MRHRILAPSDFRRMPWRNGRGTTLELARVPADGEAFDWRLSAADVASDGPFSLFPGRERVLVLLAGDGIELSHGDGRTTRLARLFEQVRFSGDEPIVSRLLGGPIRDFNAIVDRGRFDLAVEVVRAGGPSAVIASPATLLVFAFDGAARVGAVEVPAGHLLHTELAAGPTIVASAGVALAVVLRER